MTEHAPCVLLIEDDFQIRRVVRNALERQGMRVEEAAACASGLEKAGQVTPELVVLDLGLPDQDGIDFINTLPDADAIVIAADGKVSYSKGLQPPQ